jgi:hypothetical protein
MGLHDEQLDEILLVEVLAEVLNELIFEIYLNHSLVEQEMVVQDKEEQSIKEKI